MGVGVGVGVAVGTGVAVGVGVGVGGGGMILIVTNLSASIITVATVPAWLSVPPHVKVDPGIAGFGMSFNSVPASYFPSCPAARLSVMIP